MMCKQTISVIVVGAILAFAGVPAFAESTKPKPSATPIPRFSFYGKLRTFDYVRQNASNSAQGGANQAVNQGSYNTGINLHGEYHANDAWTIGGTYFYSNPLNTCVNSHSHLSPPCGKVSAPGLNPDDSIPSFELNTLYEAYVQYRDTRWYGKLGDQVYNTPWAPAADTRIKPAAYQGVDVVYAVDPHWQVQVSDMIRYEPRTSSQFDKSTLITGFPAGNAGIGSNIYVPGGTYLANNGFAYARIGYTSAQKATVNLHYYAFDQIANMIWLDVRAPLAGRVKPFVGAHFGSEKSSGKSLVGKIDASILGVLAGLNVAHNAVLSVGYDRLPVRTDTIVLPAGYSCKNGTISGTANSANGVSLPYFLPSGGTSNCSPGPSGTTNIYYGGIASPYSDNYTADPLYTTSLTQGMVERRSPGDSLKATLTITSGDRRLVTYVSRAYYNYDTPGSSERTAETNFDLTYYLKALPKVGGYRGLFFRYRYGERTQTGTPNFGGLPLFKNSRFQAEYDF